MLLQYRVIVLAKLIDKNHIVQHLIKRGAPGLEDIPAPLKDPQRLCKNFLF